MPGNLTAEFSQDYTKGHKSRSFAVGGSIQHLSERLASFQHEVKYKAIKMIVSDLAARIPNPVSAAVSEKYNVGKLASIKRRQASNGKRQPLTARGNTAVKVRYNDDESYIEFSGSHFDWPAWANKQQKVPALRKNKKGKRVRKPYKVFREIIRGQRTEITADPPTKIFVQGEKGHLRIFVRTPPGNRPLLLGSTSIPQAIAQPRTVEVWAPQVESLIQNRVEHSLDYVSKHLKTH